MPSGRNEYPMNPELFTALSQLVDDACSQMVADGNLATAAYDRYHNLAQEAYASKQVYEARKEALRLLCINQPQGCEL